MAALADSGLTLLAFLTTNFYFLHRGSYVRVARGNHTQRLTRIGREVASDLANLVAKPPRSCHGRSHENRSLWDHPR
jgi:hypothetical protein